MVLVETFFKSHGKLLGMELVTGAGGLKRPIKTPEAHRPGLSLSGYLKNHVCKRVLIFGRTEIEYLQELDPKVRMERLQPILTEATPAVIVARNYQSPKELYCLCENRSIPLFSTQMSTMHLLGKLTRLLNEEFAPKTSLSGTLVEVFGVGLFIQGKSSVGKTEAALGLIRKGHRLISDDVVMVKRCEGNSLEGSGEMLTRHHMEIRGIGIINIAKLFGAAAVRESKKIDVIVELQIWDEQKFAARIVNEKSCDILGVRIPMHPLPVGSGRDVVLLLETIALNHRLKEEGYNSAEEFNSKLLERTSRGSVETE